MGKLCEKLYNLLKIGKKISLLFFCLRMSRRLRHSAECLKWYASHKLCFIVLEVTIRRQVHCGHKGMERVINITHQCCCV